MTVHCNRTELSLYAFDVTPASPPRAGVLRGKRKAPDCLVRGEDSLSVSDGLHQFLELPPLEARIINLSIEAVVTADVSKSNGGGLPIPLANHVMFVGPLSSLDGLLAEEASRSLTANTSRLLNIPSRSVHWLVFHFPLTVTPSPR